MGSPAAVAKSRAATLSTPCPSPPGGLISSRLCENVSWQGIPDAVRKIGSAGLDESTNWTTATWAKSPQILRQHASCSLIVPMG